jgi:hypothetical protein
MVFYDSVFFSFLMMKLKFVYIKDEVINMKKAIIINYIIIIKKVDK